MSSPEFEDLTKESLMWLDDPDPVAAFASWIGAQPERVQIGFAALRVRPPFTDLREELHRVAAHCGVIRDVIADGRWRERVAHGVDAALAVVGDPPSSSVIPLVGPGRSNASATYWRGEGLVFLWLESWLGSRGTGQLQDLDANELSLWVAHELGHAYRAAIPGTGAREPRRLDQLVNVWSAWDVRIESSLADAIFEEGMATAFAAAAYPEAPPDKLLLMPADAVAWMDEHWEVVLADRRRRWDVARSPSELAWVADALLLSPRRSPWTVEAPPPRWGYYVGLRWARAALTGDWRRDLAMPTPEGVSGL